VQVGPLSVNFAHRRIVLLGREVSLTRIENELLKVFLTHETIPNQAICLLLDWNGLPIRRRRW
jgi:DNA-binding response OmpR family regulator